MIGRGSILGPCLVQLGLVLVVLGLAPLDVLAQRPTEPATKPGPEKATGPFPAGLGTQDDAATVRRTYQSGRRVSRTLDKLSLSTLTGQSPWLVMGLGGAYEYWQAGDDPARQARLSFFARPEVFGTILGLVLLVACKDFLLTWLGFLKAPLNALGELLHLSGGVLAVLYLGQSAAQWGPWREGSVAVAAEYASLSGPWALAEPNPPDAPPALYQAGLFLVMCVIHAAVWIVFNGVEVLILLNPFPLVDSLLKASRTALIGLISAASEWHPLLGFLLALPVVLVCFWIVPTAWRFTVLGLVVSGQALGWLFRRPAPPAPGEALAAFAAWRAPGLPSWSYGALRNTPTGLQFTFRRCGFLWRRTVTMPTAELLRVRRGWFLPSLVACAVPASQSLSVQNTVPTRTWFLFPPRYIRHETNLANQLGLPEPLDRSWRASLSQAWQAIRSLWSS